MAKYGPKTGVKMAKTGEKTAIKTGGAAAPVNLCAKSRTKDNPYEVWASGDGWRWSVLKKYQSPAKEIGNGFARWFCFVVSPYCRDGEYGDCYVKDIVSGAVKIG